MNILVNSMLKSKLLRIFVWVPWETICHHESDKNRVRSGSYSSLINTIVYNVLFGQFSQTIWLHVELDPCLYQIVFFLKLQNISRTRIYLSHIEPDITIERSVCFQIGNMQRDDS